MWEHYLIDKAFTAVFPAINYTLELVDNINISKIFIYFFGAVNKVK